MEFLVNWWREFQNRRRLRRVTTESLIHELNMLDIRVRRLERRNTEWVPEHAPSDRFERRDLFGVQIGATNER